jgi:hypothetical protein
VAPKWIDTFWFLYKTDDPNRRPTGCTWCKKLLMLFSDPTTAEAFKNVHPERENLQIDSRSDREGIANFLNAILLKESKRKHSKKYKARFHNPPLCILDPLPSPPARGDSVKLYLIANIRDWAKREPTSADTPPIQINLTSERDPGRK